MTAHSLHATLSLADELRDAASLVAALAAKLDRIRHDHPGLIAASVEVTALDAALLRRIAEDLEDRRVPWVDTTTTTTITLGGA